MDEKKVYNAVAVFDKYALSYQSKYMDVSLYHPSLDLFCSSLSAKNSKILELACGPGNITRYLIEKNPNLHILATDLSPAMLALAQKNNPAIDCQLLDCKAIPDLHTLFDGIICGFGLPYLSKDDALQLIADAATSLNKGGLIYLSTMEDEYSKSGFRSSSTNPNEGLIMYFHEADYLLDGLKVNGFEIIDVSRIRYTDERDEEVTDLIIIAKKLN